MALVAGATRIFDNEALVPEAWREHRSDGFRVFNPTLLPGPGGGFVMAYRVVSAALGRKIALCRLDAGLEPVPGSVTPFQPEPLLAAGRFTEATRAWQADPRFFQLDGRAWLYWNDGYKRPHNNQFILELDPATLAPLGRPKLLTRAGGRQMIEKNWGLFFEEGIRALYAADPFTLLQAGAMGEEELVFAEVLTLPGPPAAPGLGVLRGGAAPVLFEGEYYSFCHAVTQETKRLRHYEAAVHSFAAGPQAGPRRAALRPLALPNPFGGGTRYPPLNPLAGRIIYVCGALRLPAGWLLSYGINDERCALHLLSQAEVDAHMAPPPG
ncbi:hypothetical protein [Roseomonas sp. 18066]|uniref:hypothetical protein n=1 Tax=Roseomonas sp. 18066 TaxID=2681412 RepID=UPI00135955AF|nr:hypothetical protein [Roseomonas sp. 18066]